MLRTAEVRAAERASAIHTRIDHLARALLRLAEHLHERTQAMSATTDAIKADLAALETAVDSVAEKAALIAKDALAAEEAELAEIRTHIEAIGGKVEALLHDVAAAPAVSASPTA